MTGTIPEKIVPCFKCGMKCAFVQNVQGKWYLSPIAIDGKIYKVHGKNGMFYPAHNCKKKDHTPQGEEQKQ